MNAASFADVGERFSVYANADIFGYPVSVLPVLYITGSVLCLLCITLYLPAFSGKISFPEIQLRVKRKIRIKGSVNLFLHESFRLFVPALGILVLLLYGGINYRRLEDELKLNTEEYWYYAYGQEISGEVTEENLEWFEQKRDEIEKEQAALHEFQKQMDTMSPALSQTLEAKTKAIERVFQEYMTLISLKQQGIPVHYISAVITDPVFSDITPFLLYGFLMLTLISFSSNSLFSEDEETGLLGLVRSAKNGRKKVFYTRYFTILLLYTAAFIIYVFPMIYNWLRVYHMQDFETPVQSILSYSHLKGSMNLRTMMILWMAAAFVSGAGYQILLSLMTRLIHKKSTTLIVTVFIIVIDFLMVILNFPVISLVMFASGYALPKLLIELSDVRFLWFILGKNIVMASGLFLVHRHFYVKQTERN